MTDHQCSDSGHQATCVINTHVPGRSLINETKLSVKQAADAMGIGETSVRRLISNGDLLTLRIGGRIFILESDIEDYLRDQYGTAEQGTSDLGRLPRLTTDIVNSEHLKQ